MLDSKFVKTSEVIYSENVNKPSNDHRPLLCKIFKW